MTNLTKIIGVDISKLKFDASFEKEEKHQVKQFENNHEGFTAFAKKLEKGSRVVMEASGPYYLRLATFLYEKGFAVSVVNPLVIRRYSQMLMQRAKTDKADAIIIASYGKDQPTEDWTPPKKHEKELRDLESLLSYLIKQRTGILNQLEALTQSGEKESIAKIFATEMLNHLKIEIDKIEEKMEEIMNVHYQDLNKQLQTIPGIGPKAARVLVVATRGFIPFENSKQLASYFGVSPRVFESGSSVKGKRKICKMGMGYVRKCLYVCAWSAIKYNKSCKELYERLVIKGKNKRLALIAVVNKLIKQIFAIAKKRVDYQENFSTSIAN